MIKLTSKNMQDLFAELRPNMMRYSSMEEVNAALVELEEHEHTASTDKTISEKHSDTEKTSSRTTPLSISADRPSVLDGSEENGGMHEEIGDSDSESGSGTIEPEEHDEDDLDEETRDDGCDTDEEDEDDGGPVSDEDDEVHVRQKVAELDPQEVANFEQELKAVVQASFCLFLIIAVGSHCIFIVYSILILMYLRIYMSKYLLC